MSSTRTAQRLNDDDRHELAQFYLLPDVAEQLIAAACDQSATELAARAGYALAWLDPDQPNAVPRSRERSATDVIADAVADLVRATVLCADARTRRRCQGLVAAIVREAEQMPTHLRRVA